MTAQPDQSQFALQRLLSAQEETSPLRIVVCGSVDHGKSTLIGRLLYEADGVFDDQLESLKQLSRRHGSANGDIDFSLLLDGLAAEREQKITIDVAYRFFATDRRKFIIADAPGHEQYTRNMATGASTADVALILVNAASGLTAQTRRHSLIVSMLGVRQFVVAVNKMDLVGWSEAAFRAIEDDFRQFADELGVNQTVCIPVSARGGENVVAPSAAMPWYRGPSVLAQLEQMDVVRASHASGFRMPVQWVNRPNADFRGYSGLVTSGTVKPGMDVQILPSGETTRVVRIVTFDGDLDRAEAGRSVTLTLAHDVAISRGDVISSQKDEPIVSDRLSAHLVWMGKAALTHERSYLLKLGTSVVSARVEAPLRMIDLNTRKWSETDRLTINDIGACTLQLDRPIAADEYRHSKGTGSFILIDPESYDTIAMGMIARP
jgi:sulfate adenylyltransferase large subunit